jgi:hypothetical protein
MDFPKLARCLTPEEENQAHEFPMAITLRTGPESFRAYLVNPQDATDFAFKADIDLMEPTPYIDSQRAMGAALAEYGQEIKVEELKKMAGNMSKQRLSDGMNFEYEIHMVKI